MRGRLKRGAQETRPFIFQNAKFQFKGGVAFDNINGDSTALDFSKNLGQKWGNSFQVKREIFDKLLIDDANEKGCDVEYETEVIAYDEVKNIITIKGLS